MSRIEITRNTNTGQPTLVNEGEHKGKHGTDGFVKKASFLARIFGYYVKVGEHYLNPKSLANYTNEKNAGKGEPILKPRWIGGTPKAKIEAAFLKLFPTQTTTLEAQTPKAVRGTLYSNNPLQNQPFSFLSSSIRPKDLPPYDSKQQMVFSDPSSGEIIIVSSNFEKGYPDQTPTSIHCMRSLKKQSQKVYEIK